jgi:hypothetical protein
MQIRLLVRMQMQRLLIQVRVELVRLRGILLQMKLQVLRMLRIWQLQMLRIKQLQKMLRVRQVELRLRIRQLQKMLRVRQVELQLRIRTYCNGSNKSCYAC